MQVWYRGKYSTQLHLVLYWPLNCALVQYFTVVHLQQYFNQYLLHLTVIMALHCFHVNLNWHLSTGFVRVLFVLLVRTLWSGLKAKLLLPWLF